MDNHSSLTEVVEAVQLLASHTMPRHHRLLKQQQREVWKDQHKSLNWNNMQAPPESFETECMVTSGPKEENYQGNSIWGGGGGGVSP